MVQECLFRAAFERYNLILWYIDEGLQRCTIIAQALLKNAILLHTEALIVIAYFSITLFSWVCGGLCNPKLLGGWNLKMARG